MQDTRIWGRGRRRFDPLKGDTNGSRAFVSAGCQPDLPRLNPTTTWAPPPPRNPPERLVAELDPQRLLTPVALLLKLLVRVA